MTFAIAGGEPENLPGLVRDLLPLAWRGRSRRVPRQNGRDDIPTATIYRIHAATGRRMPVRTLTARDSIGFAGVWNLLSSRDGRRIGYSVF